MTFRAVIIVGLGVILGVVLGMPAIPAAARQPATPLLLGLVGQTCTGRVGGNSLLYTIRHQNDQWKVHDLVGAPGQPRSSMRDGGWIPATVDGSSVTFPGREVDTITLTATGPHSISGLARLRIRMWRFALTCSQA